MARLDWIDWTDMEKAATFQLHYPDKPPPNAPTVHTDQHAHGRDSTHHASGIFARTTEHQSVGASVSADGKHSFSTTRRSIAGLIWCAVRELQPSRPVW